MKAVVHHRYGGPEVLELAEVAPPKIHVDSVLVRVQAAAVNPADLAMRAGHGDATVATYFPVIPGWDIAGVVEQVGIGFCEFEPGDEVIGHVRASVAHQHGGYDTTAEIRVRIAVALLIGLVVLAAKVGLQTILGAFLAGVVLNLVDSDTASHPEFYSKLNALGYGFMIPVFFVSSGVQLDLRALTSHPSAMARIPLFLLALMIVRGAPAVLYVRTVGRRGAVADGLLQATSLPVIVSAASIGVALRVVAPRTAAALVAAGLLSVLIFPVLALGVIRADTQLIKEGV
jgi:hypothetical protein